MSAVRCGLSFFPTLRLSSNCKMAHYIAFFLVIGSLLQIVKIRDSILFISSAIFFS